MEKKNAGPGTGGFTGLEAAIVLIAFVIVAAVFSYVVLGAGFLAVQKTQNVVYSSVGQVGSTVFLVGGVYGTGSGSCISSINFSVALGPGGIPLDFDQVVIIYSNSTSVETLRKGIWETQPAPGQWTVISVQNEAGRPDHALDYGEQFQISAVPTSPICEGPFTLELRPAFGVALDIKGIVPHSVQKVNRLV